jgi:hypothetical protein
MFANMGFRNTDHNEPFSDDTLAQIFAIAEHPDTKRVLYALRDSYSNESLVDERGIDEAEIYVKTWDDNCQYDSNNSEIHITMYVSESICVDVVRVRNPETNGYADFISAGYQHNEWCNVEHDIVLRTEGIVWHKRL